MVSVYGFDWRFELLPYIGLVLYIGQACRQTINDYYFSAVKCANRGTL